jgi:hypothetical protein
MSSTGGVRVGRDAFGSALVTGSNNLTFVVSGVEAFPEGLLEALRRGQVKPAELADAVPLAALILTIEWCDGSRAGWRIRAERPGEGVDASGQATASARVQPVGWDAGASMAGDLATFARLSRQLVETRQDLQTLESAAQRIGDALAEVLTADERGFLVNAGVGDPPPPLLVISSTDDQILGLPWELVRLNGSFAVRDGRLDIARTTSSPQAPVLPVPTEPLSLLVNISAPERSGLNYERESYFIIRALNEHLGVVVNEMGEVADLIEGLRRGESPPIGVHFSGHGGAGMLLFEDAHGEAELVAVDALLTEIRRRTSERLPRFFYLACCHGGDARLSNATDQGLSAVATVLHREGIAQVVGYFGPVLDELSTQAERAFYAELAKGRRTRDAVRAARYALSHASVDNERSPARDMQSSVMPLDGLAYAWAQIVLYQRGPDHALGTPITSIGGAAPGTTARAAVEAYPGSRVQILKSGFVGRRKEMHALRRDLRSGRHLHVVYGLGGLGKSAFCAEALKVYAREDWQPVALWCSEAAGHSDLVAELVRQMDAAGATLLGSATWQQITDLYEQIALHQPSLQHSAGQFCFLLRALLNAYAKPVVIYLDNLETLQVGAAEGDNIDAFAEWRDARCVALWQGLRELQQQNANRLAILASTRNRQRDFGAGVAFRRLPDDAMWRVLQWFPNLRQLSATTRGDLVARLAGHPRSVEYLDTLVGKAINDWEYDTGAAFSPGCLNETEERAQLIDRLLPRLDQQLSENLLFDALWDRLLDEPARALLVRASVLRRPGTLALMRALADGNHTAVERLRQTALLSEIREAGRDGQPSASFEVHPTVIRLMTQRCEPQLCHQREQEGHQRGAEHYATLISNVTSSEDIEAAYHLRQHGQPDRSLELLQPLIDAMLDRGHYRETHRLLAEIGEFDALSPRHAATAYRYLGDAIAPYGNLQATLAAYRAGLAIAERLAAADPSSATAQRDLFVSHNKVGDVLVAQGQGEAALAAYRAGLAIAERLAAADPSSATTQRDLTIVRGKMTAISAAQCFHGASTAGDSPFPGTIWSRLTALIKR